MNMFKSFAVVVVAFLGYVQTIAADQENTKSVATLKIALYRVVGDISGDTSLTDDIFEGLARPDPRAKSPYSIFTLAKLTLGGVKLEADAAGWTWDGQDELPAGRRVQRIAKPSIKSKVPGESVWMKVDSADPIQYFHKRDDGLFDLRVAPDNVGLTISTAVEQGASKRLVLRDFNILTTFVEKRMPIEAVNLDVGEPILSRVEDKTTVALKPGLNYGILLTSKNNGVLLVRLQIDVKD
jgi:hypothetical protein